MSSYLWSILPKIHFVHTKQSDVWNVLEIVLNSDINLIHFLWRQYILFLGSVKCTYGSELITGIEFPLKSVF